MLEKKVIGKERHCHQSRNILALSVIIGLSNLVYIGCSCGHRNKWKFIYDESYQIIDTDFFLEVQLIGERKYRGFKPKQRWIENPREKLFSEVFNLNDY